MPVPVEPAAAATPGTVLAGRFTLREKLGQGGMATVYLAHDALADAPVALKVLHPHLRDDPLILERFKREIAAVRRVAHPNIITVYDLLVTDTVACLVLEHYPGVNLKYKLRRDGPLKGDALVRVAEQILDGLSAAHAEGVVHRDLKPHNILIDDTGRIKLTDFGLARIDDLVGMTTNTLSLGTPEYMAPELFASSVVDARADLYSLGVTLFELASGRLPYRASSPAALLAHHTHQAVLDIKALCPELHQGLAAAITRALARDPEDRFQTAAEMRAALAGTTDLTRPAHPDPDTNRCRRCQAPLLPRISACVECGFEPITLSRQKDGRCRVVVCSGNARFVSRHGDLLTFEQKHDLVQTLRELGATIAATTEEVDARLRSLPVVAADRLRPADARKLARVLRTKRILARLERHGFLGLLPHVLQGPALVAGATTGLFTAVLLGVFFQLSFGPLVAPLSGLAVAAWAARRTLVPIAEFRGDTGTAHSDSPLFADAKHTFASVTSPRLRALLRRILTRGADLMSLLATHEETLSLAERTQGVLHAALAQARRLTALEAEHADLDPRALYETVQALDVRIAAARSVSTAEALIEEKLRASALFARHEWLEREIAHSTGELLMLSHRLGELRRGLTESSAENALETAPDELAAALAELEIELAARRETETAVTGGR